MGSLKELRNLCVMKYLEFKFQMKIKPVLEGQRIQIKALVDQIAQSLPSNANELQVHQYARYYVLALLAPSVCMK